ncbi:hypothetical protein ACFWA5_07500 [Streptomyces mirabilis]|uniref:hypothetical protein n=1 Tax=Streptomyces mirabilis TaxID=68239 RepID=UPI003658C376
MGARLDLGFYGPLFLAPLRFERVRTSIAATWGRGLRLSVAVAAAGFLAAAALAASFVRSPGMR